MPTLVTDTHGHALGNLRQQDFQTLDKGKKQVITGFTIQTRENSGAPSSIGAPKANVAVQPYQGSATAQKSASRYTAFLFDDLHLDRGNLVQVRKAASQTVARSANDTDMAAVLSTSGRINTGFTRDQTKLQAAISSLRQVLTYSHSRNECPDIDHYEAYLILYAHDPQALEVVAGSGERCPPPPGNKKFDEGVALAAARWEMPRGEQATNFTLDVVNQVVRQMGNLPGQRTLILISSGFIALTPAALEAKSRVMDIAARANVTINVLDARGIDAEMEDENKRLESQDLNLFMRQDRIAQSDAMAQLAAGTGGTYFHNSNDFQGGLAGFSVPPEYLYLLQFSPSGVKEDGTFHSLKVKVNAKGVNVQSRSGYFAPRGVTR